MPYKIELIQLIGVWVGAWLINNVIFVNAISPDLQKA